MINIFRNQIKDILFGNSQKKALIVGPCSIHDTNAALKYALFVKDLQELVHDRLLLVMRVFLEKPRTANSWKGFISDPYLDDSLDIESGLEQSIQLLNNLQELHIPCATEFIDPYIAFQIEQYISWGFIGARTVRSPTHRQLAAFLNMPIGFKNPLDGDLYAVDQAISVACTKHKAFLPAQNGKIEKKTTLGNFTTHMVLRGSVYGSNHHESLYLKNPLIIDCAHGNSSKTLEGMEKAFYESMQYARDHSHIKGLMLESFIEKGSQKLSLNLKKNISITDPCLDLKTTKKLILDFYKLLSQSHGSSSVFTGSSLKSKESSSDTVINLV